MVSEMWNDAGEPIIHPATGQSRALLALCRAMPIRTVRFVQPYYGLTRLGLHRKPRLFRRSDGYWMLKFGKHEVAVFTFENGIRVLGREYSALFERYPQKGKR